MTAQSTPKEGEDGFALVVVLWFLVLLAAFVGPFALAARTSAMITSNQREKVKLDLLADGLTTFVAAGLAGDPRFAETLPLNGAPIDCSTRQVSIRFHVQDQTGLVDLNAADVAAISAGLLALGVGQDQLQDISSAIIAYRSYAASFNDLAPANIVIADGPKRAPFESVIELADFGPLARFEAAELHAAFTVHSGTGLVMRSAAPAKLSSQLTSLPVSGAPSRGLRAVAIETSVQNSSTSIAGYAGYIVELDQGPNSGFQRIETLMPPASAISEVSPSGSCPAWLAGAIAAIAGDLA